MKTLLSSLFISLVVVAATGSAYAQTAFTYQGQLRDGSTNANGNYTLVFKLFDALSGGGQIGSPITNNATLVSGLFTVSLDYGAAAFNGSPRWLDITVQSGATVETLSPRVPVLPVPYALYASSAGNVTNSAISAAKLASDPAGLAQVTGGAAYVTNNNSITFTNSVSTPTVSAYSVFTYTNFAGMYFGDGSGLFHVPHFQVFENPGTFTFNVPTNVSRVMVEVWGAGGGGGGGGSTANGFNGGNGGGGGGGGYAKDVLNVTPGGTLSITVGFGGGAGNPSGAGGGGGSSSAGTIVATGGNGGFAGGNDSVNGSGSPGNGGNPGGGNTAAIKLNGVQGAVGGNGANGQGGAGANGGAGGRAGGSFPGSFEVGQSPGGGGSGGIGGFSPIGGNQPGGSGNAGAFGRVIIWY